MFRLWILLLSLLGFWQHPACAQPPIITLTECETLTGWGNGAQTVLDAKQGQKAIQFNIPTNQTGFLTFNYQSTNIDISQKHTLAFWWKAEGSGLQDLKIKIRNYPLVGGMEAVYTIWSGLSVPEGWQLATIELAKPLFDDWGNEPDQTRRYITFRTITGANATAKLSIDQIVAIDKTFSYETAPPTLIQTSIEKYDLDSDNQVGFSDFILFVQYFSNNDSVNFEPRFDFNNDGLINFADFILFAQHFGSDGTNWQLPLTLNNITNGTLEVTIGTNNTSLMTHSLAPGMQTLSLTLPQNLISNRKPSDTIPIPIWVQVSNFVQTRQSSISYIPQTGTSHTYQQFVEASQSGNEPILPDFSYSGYHYFAKPIPDVTGTVYNVTDYGAIANDGFSDQLAIQRAIDDAERNNGGIVFFPPGEFLVNTNTDNNQVITIRNSHMVLRGSGSRAGGTVIRQVNYMPPTNPDQMWTSPYMFLIKPSNTSDKELAKITQNSQRETFQITVNDASKLFVGQRITLYMNSVSAISDF
ncbi:MAG: glycosyl hydrolase family 28-related protein, partial [Candidatus Latescibacterota bacterium]